ncbi:MAG TPA: zinc ABC transporter substrate-binding protein [Opitutaceae bacterium]
MKAISAFMVLGLAACAAAGAPAKAAPIRVVTLSTVLTEISREVGGAEVDVLGLVGPGIDPHTFNPSPADMRSVLDADLVLASGLNLEGYLDRLVASVGPGGRVVAVGDFLPLVLSTPGGGEKDPHWWHSIPDMVAAVELVRGEFARLRPASSGLFARNAAEYTASLRDLESWAASEAARLPPVRRVLVTSHDAFGYLAHDYGFTVHSISGLSTDSEADAKHLAGLVDLIRGEHIPAIFVESSANARLVENLLDETGARLGGMLYADGLGTPGSGAETYAAMYRHNLGTIVAALSRPQGSPP